VSAHLRAQALRFARMTGLALGTAFMAQGGTLPLTWRSLWVLLPGTAEVLLRELVPVAPLPVVTAVPAPPGETGRLP
jgi:hypothetical protein